MNIYNSEKEIIQNLKDAGCKDRQIEEIIALFKEGKKDKICKILEKHRCNVLNNVHKKEKQIDCIDYFIYQIERGEKT